MEHNVHVLITHQRLYLREVDQLEEQADDDLQLGDMLEQVDRLELLVIDEEEIVLLNMVAHHEENEGEKGANGHGNRKN